MDHWESLTFMLSCNRCVILTIFLRFLLTSVFYIAQLSFKDHSSIICPPIKYTVLECLHTDLLYFPNPIVIVIAQGQQLRMVKYWESIVPCVFDMAQLEQ